MPPFSACVSPINQTDVDANLAGLPAGLSNLIGPGRSNACRDAKMKISIHGPKSFEGDFLGDLLDPSKE